MELVEFNSFSYLFTAPENHFLAFLACISSFCKSSLADCYINYLINKEHKTQRLKHLTPYVCGNILFVFVMVTRFPVSSLRALVNKCSRFPPDKNTIEQVSFDNILELVVVCLIFCAPIGFCIISTPD